MASTARPTPPARSWTAGRSRARAPRAGLAGAASRSNDAIRFFAALGDAILWGPTGTNVGDLHVLLLACRYNQR